MSIEVGKDDWFYTSCKTCPKKVVENKDRCWCDQCRRVDFKAILRYRLQIIVTDESGCIKLLLWNKEAEQMVEKATVEKVEKNSHTLNKNVNAVEGVYSVTKLSNDECLMSNFGCANSCDASFNEILANTPITETNDETNGHVAVCLSKDSAVESNGDNSYQTPAKRSCADACDGSMAEAPVSANVQASANKTFKRNYGKKKMD
ncbi:hypothetical protein AHAS_Ahas18G0135400 [Arachis hypogaea]